MFEGLPRHFKSFKSFPGTSQNCAFLSKPSIYDAHRYYLDRTTTAKPVLWVLAKLRTDLKVLLFHLIIVSILL